MSGDHPSKSGSSKTKEDCSDDELVTWLQYPLEDSFEKSYCSDGSSLKQQLQQWPPPSAASGPSRSRAAVFCSDASASAAAASMALCTEIDRFSGAPWMHTRLANAKAGMMLQRSASAEGALAMGAQRAAGLAPRSVDATVIPAKSRGPPSQPQVCPRPTMPPSPHHSMIHLVPTSYSAIAAAKASSSVQKVPKADISMRSNSMPVPGALADKLLYRQAQGGLLQHSFASSPWPGQEQNEPSCQRLQNSNSDGGAMDTTFSAERLRKGCEGRQVASPKGCSNVTEETVWTSSDYMSQEYHICDTQKGSSSCGSFPGRRGLTPGRGGGAAASYVNPPPPMPGVVATCSGGSQASADLSPQDEGHKGKRKAAEISECQSEEVDEESVEIKQPQRTSSKRNRAAEVHNLSERNRRNRINEKLKALQDLIPNSTKTDKASVLDEAIEYMKSLQMQLQMVSMRSNMNVSPVMIPVGMPHLQMAPLQTVGLGFPIGHAGMGMAMGMGMGMGQGLMPAYQSAIPGVNHFIMPYQDVATSNEIQGGNKPEFPTIDIPPQSPEQGHTRVHGMFYTSPHHEQGPRVSQHLDSP